MRQEMIEFWDGSGISWAIHKQSAPNSRQITTLTTHHSIFTGRMPFLLPNQQRQGTEGAKGISVVICLELGADCSCMAQLMPLPSQNPIISCLI